MEDLTAQRDVLAAGVGSVHGRGSGVALSAMRKRSEQLAEAAGLEAMHGPGLVVTLTDAQRDANGRFPGTPPRRPGGAPTGHLRCAQRIVEFRSRSGADAGPADHRGVGAALRGQHPALGRPNLQPPYVVTAIGDPAAMQAALAADPLITLYKQYVIRFGLGYSEQVGTDLVVAETPAVARMRYAVPAGPVDY